MPGISLARVCPGLPSSGQVTEHRGVCRGRSSTGAGLEAQCRQLAPDRLNPVSGVFERSWGHAPLALGLCFPRFHVDGIWEKETGKRKRNWPAPPTLWFSARQGCQLGYQLAQVRRPDLEVVAVVSQCSRQVDSCQGPGHCHLTLMLQIRFMEGTPSLTLNLGS